MALNWKHWTIGAVAGAALIAYGMLPPAVSMFRASRADTPPVVAERVRLSRVTTVAVNEWKAAALRDSIVHLLAGRPPAADSALVIETGSDLSAAMRSAAARLISARWKELGIDRPVVPIVVVVLSDTAGSDEYGVSRSGGVQHVLPGDPAADQQRCISIIRLVNNSAGVKRLVSAIGAYGQSDQRSFRGAPFGVCAFYAAFGRPGPRIAAWLASRGHDVAALPSWDGPGSHVDRENDNHVFTTFVGYSDLNTTSVDGRRCWLGDAATCERTVLDGWAARTAESETLSAALRRSTWRNASEYLLSDMVRDFGPGTFGRFWRADGEPSAAFAAATNESLGSWTLRWVRRHYGNTLAGARVPTGLAVSGLLLAAGCIGVAMVIAARRTL